MASQVSPDFFQYRLGWPLLVPRIEDPYVDHHTQLNGVEDIFREMLAWIKSDDRPGHYVFNFKIEPSQRPGVDKLTSCFFQIEDPDVAFEFKMRWC